MSKYILGDIFEGDFPITQIYGNNPSYYAQFGLAGHEGIDFGTPDGTPILAPFDGVILRDTFNDKDYGNFTVVWDPKQLCAVWFCHLKDVTTKVGDKVKKGQLLGHTNNTGNTTGPHLHFNFVETDAQGNRLNLKNGYQGFLNALDSNLVTWQLSGKQITIPQSPIPTGGLPANYGEIVHGSSQWDATVSKYLPEGTDPTHTDFTALQAVVAGIQSNQTATGNNLTKALQDNESLKAQIGTEQEKLAEEEKQRQDDAIAYLAQIKALKDTTPISDKVTGVYMAQIGALQKQVKELIIQKGVIASELAKCQATPKVSTNWLDSLLSALSELLIKKK